MSEQANWKNSSLDDIWGDLIASILAVNNRSLEKTYALLPLLRRAGVVEAVNLTHWEGEEVTVRLKAAGFDQGDFMTGLFARRLVSLGGALRSRGVAACREILLSNDPDAIRNLLLPVNGIGPKVMSNFFLLRGIRERE